MKNKVITLLLLMSLALSNMTVLASENTGEGITKSYTFTSKEKDATCDEEFEEVIKENGTRYKLKSINYEVVKTTPVTVKKEVEKEVESGYVPEDETYEPEETITEDGITYTLDSFEKVDEDVTAQKVTGYYDYDHKVNTADVPSQREFTVKNELTGEEETVVCNLQSVEAAYGKWVDTYIDLTFESYDSVAFEWQGVEIPKNETNPLKGYEDLILKAVGANSNEFKVKSVSWNGNEYTNNGIVYRDAVAAVQRYVQYYRANYVGEIEPGVKYMVTYKGTEEVESTTEFDYEIVATATYEKSISPVVIAGIGLLLLVALVVGILYLLSKKKKEEEEKTPAETKDDKNSK